MSSVDIVLTGRERLPVIVIDSFSDEPAELAAVAMDAVFIDVGSVYPGVRAPAPQGYVDALLAATAPLIEQVFGCQPRPELDLCAFSLVTTPPSELSRIQRIPHFDGPEPDRIAFLHYLCAQGQGGTSFYRHRSTGFESVSNSRVDEYRASLLEELDTDSPRNDYCTDDTRLFERVHRVDAAFNRLLIYKGNALHSGDISPDTVLSEDPRQGRLTINGFGRLVRRCDGLQGSGREY